MMRRTVLIAGFIVLAGCSEQTLVGPEAQQAFEEARASAETRRVLNEPLILLNGEKPTRQELDDLTPERIERIEVIKGTKALERFGKAATHGAVLIFTKTSDTGAG